MGEVISVETGHIACLAIGEAGQEQHIRIVNQGSRSRDIGAGRDDGGVMTTYYGNPRQGFALVTAKF